MKSDSENLLAIPFRFNRIVCVEVIGLQPGALRQLEQDSRYPVIKYKDRPQSEAELMKRIGDAEGVLMSGHTHLTPKIIENLRLLKYIGVCGSWEPEYVTRTLFLIAETRNISVHQVNNYSALKTCDDLSYRQIGKVSPDENKAEITEPELERLSRQVLNNLIGFVKKNNHHQLSSIIKEQEIFHAEDEL